MRGGATRRGKAAAVSTRYLSFPEHTTHTLVRTKNSSAEHPTDTLGRIENSLAVAL